MFMYCCRPTYRYFNVSRQESIADWICWDDYLRTALLNKRVCIYYYHMYSLLWTTKSWRISRVGRSEGRRTNWNRSFYLIFSFINKKRYTVYSQYVYSSSPPETFPIAPINHKPSLMLNNWWNCIIRTILIERIFNLSVTHWNYLHTWSFHLHWSLRLSLCRKHRDRVRTFPNNLVSASIQLGVQTVCRVRDSQWEHQWEKSRNLPPSGPSSFWCCDTCHNSGTAKINH